MKQKYILFILFSLFLLKGSAQDNYSVTRIPFQPFTGTLSPVATPDDLYTPVIALPFNFDYYGISYNQIVIGTNGYVDFRTNLAGQFSQYMVSIPVPSINFGIKNSIMGCYEDLDNSSGAGTLTVGTYGAAPARKFVVYFNNHNHWNQAAGTSAITSFQIILSEASNTIDVQIIQRQPGSTWGGRGVCGLINLDGSRGITPPGRNTGNWRASQEAWRFYRPGYCPAYSFVRCDDNTDGFQSFNLGVAAGDLNATNPSAVAFYETMNDAQANVNPIINAADYTNISNPQTIYATIGGIVKTVNLNVIDCSVDADTDTVPTVDEDVNNDTNLANDDTDFDGIPNYLDNDDDGDLVLTNAEYAFAKNSQTANALLDTDNDGIPNYLDSDDDGDGMLTFLEDYNRDGNPANDDTNTNSIPDYLESGVALGINPAALANDAVKVYPNPASNVLNIQHNTADANAFIEIYSINGTRVKSLKATEALTTIAVADLQSGVYFVKVTMNNQVGNYKFIKN